MAVIRWAGFAGENRAVEPKLLGDSVLTVSRNQKPGRGDLRSWRYPKTVASVPTGTKTIYRMGRDVQSDSSYWLSWETYVNAVRGFTSDDTTEQTFYTGDGAPKFTNNIMALASAPYPTVNRPMGLPAPLTAPVVESIEIAVPDVGKYAYTISDASLTALAVGDILRVSTDTTSALITLTGVDGVVTAASLQAQLATVGGITVTVIEATSSASGGVRIVANDAGADYNFFIQKKVGTVESYAWADVTLTPYLSAYANADSYSSVVIGTTIGATSMVAGHRYRINSIADTDFTQFGAPSNTPLLIFTATGPATGSGTVDAVTSSSGTNWSCSVTITPSMIASMTPSQRFRIEQNSEAPTLVTVAAGAGTFPPTPTAETVKSAFTQTGLTATIVSDPTTGVRSVKVALTSALATSSLIIQSVAPGVTDSWAMVATGEEIKVDDTSTLSVFYVYTYVNDLGWESAPSPASAENVRYSEAHATIGNFATVPDGNYVINTIRIYRTQTGTSATNFYFAGEVAVGTPSWVDTNGTLGELLETTTWLPAPGVPTGGSLDTTEPNLEGLTAMWNGMMAGVTGNAVRVCEPYVPYAWPKGYEVVPPDSKPVALGVFGQNLLILTTGRPVLVNGSGPDGLDQQKIEMPQACVAPRSVVNMGAGVAWASEDGLCWFGSGGARILTAGLMLREDWQALNPASIVGCMYEGLYFGSYMEGGPRGVRRGFFIDPVNPTGIFFMDQGYEAMHFDELRDHLYIGNPDGEGVSVQKWDSAPDFGEGSGYFTYRARSKVFKQRYPSTYGAAEVVATGYPVTFRLIADGQQVFETQVQSRNPFRLPGGFRAFDYQIELQGDWPVQGAAIATIMKELAEV